MARRQAVCAEFLREVKQRSPDSIRIMLTGQANTDAVMGAINEGAVYKFILKPWNDDDLRVTVALALIIVGTFGGHAIAGPNGLLAWGGYNRDLEQRLLLAAGADDHQSGAR